MWCDLPIANHLMPNSDAKFDHEEDITDFLDLAHANRPGQEQKRVNVDFSTWGHLEK
jgi:hypothetical protein